MRGRERREEEKRGIVAFYLCGLPPPLGSPRLLLSPNRGRPVNRPNPSRPPAFIFIFILSFPGEKEGEKRGPPHFISVIFPGDPSQPTSFPGERGGREERTCITSV
jgi:hypothetical protein